MPHHIGVYPWRLSDTLRICLTHFGYIAIADIRYGLLLVVHDPIDKPSRRVIDANIHVSPLAVRLPRCFRSYASSSVER